MTDILNQIKKIDQEDSLTLFKGKFKLDPDTVYLDGNSLGPLPLKTKDLLHQAIEHQWGSRLIRSWNEDWLESTERIAAKIAELIHAEADEVLITDSVSVNLYKLAFTALKLQDSKKEILTDSLNFPSDLYILQELCHQSFQNHDLQVTDQGTFESINEHILSSISKETALLSLSHVAYKSAFQYDVKRINEACQKHGALNLWDLSHSVGAVPINVKSMKMDLAVGCTYKYLNGGPGSPAFLYVSKALQTKLNNPIAGWFSHENPFDFSPEFKSSNTIRNFAVGTVPILSAKGIEPGIDLFLEAGMENIHEKSIKLFDTFIHLFQLFLKERGFSIETPLEATQRGSHIALTHKEAYRINLSLIDPRIPRKQFITDHRPPNIIRIALTPLYLSFIELYEAVLRLVEIVDTKEFLSHSPEKSGVI
ncbi:MAG: kynureninase [Arcticibacterium sp.]|jgi:kynureninase